MSLRDQIICRGATDACVLSEVWDRDEHRLYPLHRSGAQVRCAVDVGAHAGMAALLIAELWPEATVVAVEPDGQNFEALEINAGLCDRIKPFNVALGGEDGTRPFLAAMNGVHGNTAVNRFAAPGENPVPGYRRLSIPTITLRSLLETLRWDHVDLLKMDCEGAELEILRQAVVDGSIHGVRHIHGEWHGLDVGPQLETLLSPWYDFRFTYNQDWNRSLGLFQASRRKA